MEATIYSYGRNKTKQVLIDERGIHFKNTTIPFITGDYSTIDFREYRIVLFKVFIKQHRAVLILQHIETGEVIWYWYVTDDYSYPTKKMMLMTKQFPHETVGVTEPMALQNKRYQLFYIVKDGKLFGMRFTDPMGSTSVDFDYITSEYTEISLKAHIVHGVDMGTYYPVFYSDGTNELRCRIFNPVNFTLGAEMNCTDTSIEYPITGILHKRHSNKRFFLVVTYTGIYTVSYMAGKTLPSVLILEDYKVNNVNGTDFKWWGDDEQFLHYKKEDGSVGVDYIGVNAHSSKLVIKSIVTYS